MTKKLTVWLFLATLILSNDINSRPISYADSWTLMQMNNYNKHSFHLHFSPSVNYSVGYKGEYWLKNEWQFHAVQINYLINRINKPKSQTDRQFKEKIIKTFIHGFLHLLGFDHVKNKDYLKMLKEEEKIYKSVISKIKVN